MRLRSGVLGLTSSDTCRKVHGRDHDVSPACDDAIFFAEEHIYSQTQIAGHGMIMTCLGVHEERI